MIVYCERPLSESQYTYGSTEASNKHYEKRYEVKSRCLAAEGLRPIERQLTGTTC